MGKPGGMQPVELIFAQVTKGGVAQIVTHSDSLSEVFVQVERAGDSAGDLRHFQGVREPRYVVVGDWGYEHLRLVLEAAKRLAMDDAVAVALVFGADVGWRFGEGAASAAHGLSRVWREEFLSPLKSPAYAREVGCLHSWGQRNAHLRGCAFPPPIADMLACAALSVSATS